MKDNYSVSSKGVRLIIVGLLVMVSGYILMLGGGSQDLTVFNDAMFDFRRMVLSPLLIILGILFVIIAIMRRPKSEE
ncbi:MAG: DUF3098 domain-containing protein [Bacteroidales bacterium]|nr:DUF3098 domain-containing protein [Bacteroidales bacterium]